MHILMDHTVQYPQNLDTVVNHCHNVVLSTISKTTPPARGGRVYVSAVEPDCI